NGRTLPATGGSSDLTVAELLLAYLRHCDAYYRKNGQPTGEADNIRFAVRPLKRLYAHALAKDFGPLALKAVREAMIKEDLCRNEINRKPPSQRGNRLQREQPEGFKEHDIRCIAIHEARHAAASVVLGMKLFSVDIKQRPHPEGGISQGFTKVDLHEAVR